MVSTFSPYHVVFLCYDVTKLDPQPKICDPHDDDHVSPCTLLDSSPTILSPSGEST